MEAQRLTPKSLNGKTALITGASSGIGRAMARLFAAEGAKLVLGARRGALLAELAEEIQAEGGQAVTLAGDVTDEAYAAALVDQACSSFGGLDIAVNNAGIMGPISPTHELTLAEWQDTQTTNLTSAFLGAKHQLPVMVEQGRGGSLIFVSSFVGYTAAMPGVAAYATSKAGMIGLMKSLAVEYGEQNIRVNALLPGGTETDMADIMANTPEMQDFVARMHALKRLAKPEEQARAALFLASDAASFVTGSAMLCDGGVSISKT